VCNSVAGLIHSLWTAKEIKETTTKHTGTLQRRRGEREDREKSGALQGGRGADGREREGEREIRAKVRGKRRERQKEYKRNKTINEKYH
jgi:hypothetical protein